MKLPQIILCLIGMTVVVLLILLSGTVPEKLLTPVVGVWAIFITLIGLYISSNQWQKNRLETEFLKEQFRLLKEYLEYLQNNRNYALTVVSHGGRMLKDGLNSFSAIHFTDLKSVQKSRYLVINIHATHINPQLFAELNSPIIYNPLFPKELYEVLNRLDTKEYLQTANYPRDWYKDIFLSYDRQLIFNIGTTNESIEEKPLRIPYGNEFLKVSDVLKIYEDFNNALRLWFKQHHIDPNLKILNPTIDKSE